MTQAPFPRFRGGACLAAAIVACLLPARGASAADVGLRPDVVFTGSTPLAGNAELARRLLSPLAAAQIPVALARLGKALAEQPVDAAREHFVLYVPPRAPPGGYGLLVFVPPWSVAKLPAGWATVLDRRGMIFVSAARSGNDASPIGRREPLALIAAANVAATWPVNLNRVYVAGFSGGSRVAMRLALGYPDVFHGALLNAGSDEIADVGAPLPPRDLFVQFQNSTRLVYVTGDRDEINLSGDAGSMRSMREWCVFGVTAQIMPAVGHAAPDPAALNRALDALERPAAPDRAKLAACRTAIEGQLTTKLQEVAAAKANGHAAEARRLLLKVDRRFGGLAGSRAVELDRELAGSRP